jgi:hypothetical protein
MAEKNRLHTQSQKDGLPVKEDQISNQSLKQVRGMNSKAGHSPNEAGTDQRVEDAKQQRGNNQKKRIVSNALAGK